MSPPEPPAQALISLPRGFDHLKALEAVKMGARTSHPNPSLAITIDASWCYVRGAGRDPSPVLVRSDNASRECQPPPSVLGAPRGLPRALWQADPADPESPAPTALVGVTCRGDVLISD
jgi:hypothetical protein